MHMKTEEFHNKRVYLANEAGRVKIIFNVGIFWNIMLRNHPPVDIISLILYLVRKVGTYYV